MRSMPRILSCLKHTVSAEVQLEEFALKLSSKSTCKNIKGFYVLMSSLTYLSGIEIQYSWVNRKTEELIKINQHFGVAFLCAGFPNFSDLHFLVVTSVMSKISNPIYILIFLVKCVKLLL